jgi:uridine kinase
MAVSNRPPAADHYVIAISGGSGSGKSTLADALVSEIGSSFATVLTVDAYYHDLAHLSLTERERTNFDHPDALDLALFERHVLALKRGQTIQQPCYDFETHCRQAQTVEIIPRKWIVVEGILVTATASLRDLYDQVIYVEADRTVRWQRRLQRDQRDRGRDEASIARFWARAEETFMTQGSTASQYADLVIAGEQALDANVRRVMNVIWGDDPTSP